MNSRSNLIKETDRYCSFFMNTFIRDIHWLLKCTSCTSCRTCEFFVPFFNLHTVSRVGQAFLSKLILRRFKMLSL